MGHADLNVLRIEKLADCTRCALHKHRTNIVFGEGDPDADIMFVGEGPGANEDMTGRPFVGNAGKLLTDWIEKLGRKREQVYIANVVKCRPLDNRDPYPQEIETCIPFLHLQIGLIKPKLLVALGRHAANHLAGLRLPMKELRTMDLRYENEKSGMNVPIEAVYHPSYVLRKGRGETEKETLADLRKALAVVGLSDTVG